MMRCKYGSYAHAVGEVGFSIEREYQTNSAREPYAILETWSLQGRLISRDGKTKSMDSALTKLEAAYSVPGLELSLLHADGSPTIHRIRPSECLEGPRLTKPISYPNGKGAYFATFVDFTVSLQCLRAIASPPLYMSFEETVTFEGGGPLTGMRELLREPPDKQLLRRFTLYRATQRGQAVGFGALPSIPQPLFPSALMRPASSYPATYGPRQRIGSFGFGYPVQWEYTFESATPLSGTPNYF